MWNTKRNNVDCFNAVCTTIQPMLQQQSSFKSDFAGLIELVFSRFTFYVTCFSLKAVLTFTTALNFPAKMFNFKGL